jgi:hypothetical protein
MSFSINFRNRVNLSLLDVTVLSLLLVLLASIFFSFHLLPLHSIFLEDADTMFVEELARDLNAGGYLFDWHLPQAPYLFPDLFIARFLVPLASNTGDVAIYYQSVFGVLLFSLIFWICRLCRIKPFPVMLVAIVVYSTTFFGGLSGDALAMYFGLINHHSGVAALVLLIFGFSLCHMRAGEGQNGFLLLLFLFAFIGVISDSIIALVVLPPVFCYCATMFLKKSAVSSRAVQVLIVIVFATLLGKLFGWTNPFPQDRMFLEKVWTMLPWRLSNSLEKFPADFYAHFTSSVVSSFMAICFFVSYVLAGLQVWAVFRNRCRADSPIALFSFFILMSPLMIIALQVGLGLYQGVKSSRQWAPLIYLSIVFGAIIYSHRFVRSPMVIKSIVAVTLVGFLYHVTSALQMNHGTTREPSSYSQLVDCMRENELPHGPYYVANYWTARPVRLYSEGLYEVFSYNRMSGPFTNTANIVRARKAKPQFVITGYLTKYSEVIERFGAPSAEYCAMRVGSADTFTGPYPVKILDYRDNEDVQNLLEKQMANADRTKGS